MLNGIFILIYTECRINICGPKILRRLNYCIWCHFEILLNVSILLSVETVETANDAGGGDGGGENQQVNGETQDQCVSQDAEMEEGNIGNN
jgi:hypothetical protein